MLALSIFTLLIFPGQTSSQPAPTPALSKVLAPAAAILDRADPAEPAAAAVLLRESRQLVGRRCSILVVVSSIDRSGEAIVLNGSARCRRGDASRYMTADERDDIADLSRTLAQSKEDQSRSIANHHQRTAEAAARGQLNQEARRAAEADLAKLRRDLEARVRKAEKALAAATKKHRRSADQRQAACETIAVSLRLPPGANSAEIAASAKVKLTARIDDFSLACEPQAVGGALRVASLSLSQARSIKPLGKTVKGQSDAANGKTAELDRRGD